MEHCLFEEYLDGHVWFIPRYLVLVVDDSSTGESLIIIKKHHRQIDEVIKNAILMARFSDVEFKIKSGKEIIPAT